MNDDFLKKIRETLDEKRTAPVLGRVRSLTGLAIRCALPGARIGDTAVVERPTVRGGPLSCEVVGFGGPWIEPEISAASDVLLMPFGPVSGVGPDDPVHVEPSGSRL